MKQNPNEQAQKIWMGVFTWETPRDLVLKQIKHNSEYWGSDRCKISTLLKYCQAKGLKHPGEILGDLIEKGLVNIPKKGYVGLVPGSELLEFGDGKRIQMVIPAPGRGGKIVKAPGES